MTEAAIVAVITVRRRAGRYCRRGILLLDFGSWLARLVPRRQARRSASAPASGVRRPAGRPSRPLSAAASHSTLSRLTSDQIEFLEGLIDTDPPASPPHSSDDDLFLSQMQQRWQARELDLPVLPAAAIRLTEMLRAGDTPLAPLVELIESDASLSVEVLKAANAAVFAGTEVRSIHDAVLRIGLRRLGSVLLMAQATTKVLKGGAVHNKASLLVEMAPRLGSLASLLAKTDQGEANLSFIRGTLLHVEHMVILGAVGDIARILKRPIRPSVSTLVTAFHQLGPDIREAVASSWNLQTVLTTRREVAEEYAGFRKAIVCRWLGRPLPELRDVAAAQLEGLMSQIHPRVKSADSPN